MAQPISSPDEPAFCIRGDQYLLGNEYQSKIPTHISESLAHALLQVKFLEEEFRKKDIVVQEQHDEISTYKQEFQAYKKEIETCKQDYKNQVLAKQGLEKKLGDMKKSYKNNFKGLHNELERLQKQLDTKNDTINQISQKANKRIHKDLEIRDNIIKQLKDELAAVKKQHKQQEETTKMLEQGLLASQGLLESTKNDQRLIQADLKSIDTRNHLLETSIFKAYDRIEAVKVSTKKSPKMKKSQMKQIHRNGNDPETALQSLVIGYEVLLKKHAGCSATHKALGDEKRTLQQEVEKLTHTLESVNAKLEKYRKKEVEGMLQVSSPKSSDIQGDVSLVSDIAIDAQEDVEGTNIIKNKNEN